MTGLDLARNIIRPDISITEAGGESKEGCSMQEDNPTNQVVQVKADDASSCIQTKSDLGNGSADCHPACSSETEARPAAVCHCDLYSWHRGDYTLAGDESDPGYGAFCLDAMLNLSCEGTVHVYMLLPIAARN